MIYPKAKLLIAAALYILLWWVFLSTKEMIKAKYNTWKRKIKNL